MASPGARRSIAVRLRRSEVTEAPINLVRVFTATKMREREALGDQITAWLAANPGAKILRAEVVQSSDAEFHCFSMVLFCSVGE